MGLCEELRHGKARFRYIISYGQPKRLFLKGGAGDLVRIRPIRGPGGAGLQPIRQSQSEAMTESGRSQATDAATFVIPSCLLLL